MGSCCARPAGWLTWLKSLRDHRWQRDWTDEQRPEDRRAAMLRRIPRRNRRPRAGYRPGHRPHYRDRDGDLRFPDPANADAERQQQAVAQKKRLPVEGKRAAAGSVSQMWL